MRTDSPATAGSPWAPIGWVLTIPAALGGLYAVLELGSLLGDGRLLDAPLRSLLDVGNGTRAWTGADTLAAVLVAVVGLLLVASVVVLIRQHRKGRDQVDRKARHMGSPDSLTRQAAEKKARAGSLVEAGESPGLLFARSIDPKRDLYAGWRESMLVIAGPGFGKTQGVAVTEILDAPGVVVATSNKSDVPNSIRLACERRGKYWPFDPQGITGDRPVFWFNPLRDITGPVEAEAAAQILADASRPDGSSQDGYFDSQGPSLLANLMLAAAVNGDQMPQVFRWVSNPRDGRRPVEILESKGFELSAAALQGAYDAAPDERSGLFGTASKAVKFVSSPEILRWITDDGTRPEFKPDEFVRSGRDTLISLSRKGPGDAGPLTTLLTVSVFSAAEKLAAETGRLRVPLTAVLDEMANCVRDQQLPERYSFYPGLGIHLTGILQNYAQGVGVWKEHGMQALWSGATIRLVGSGLADRKQLEDVSRLIGERFVTRVSAGSSYGRGSTRSTTTSTEREPIMGIEELAALSPGYCVVVQAGDYPVLARTVPWYERPNMAHEVNASLALYGPKS